VTTPIELVWAEIPDVHCKGLCTESCGPIGASPVEIRMLSERGIELENVEDALFNVVIGRQEPNDCPALVDGRCSVYDVRPTVCRLWGAVGEMPCPYGCEPAGGRLSSSTGRQILKRSIQVGQVKNRAQRRLQ
jgi:Fe-S-cluster containining protein